MNCYVLVSMYVCSIVFSIYVLLSFHLHIFSVLLYCPHVNLITSSSPLSLWSISIFVLCHFISFYIFSGMYVIPSLFQLSSCFVFGLMNDFLHVCLYLCLFTSLSPCKPVSVFVSIYVFLLLHLYLLSVLLHHSPVGLITSSPPLSPSPSPFLSCAISPSFFVLENSHLHAYLIASSFPSSSWFVFVFLNVLLRVCLLVMSCYVLVFI